MYGGQLGESVAPTRLERWTHLAHSAHCRLREAQDANHQMRRRVQGARSPRACARQPLQGTVAGTDIAWLATGRPTLVRFQGAWRARTLYWVGTWAVNRRGLWIGRGRRMQDLETVTSRNTPGPPTTCSAGQGKGLATLRVACQITQRSAAVIRGRQDTTPPKADQMSATHHDVLYHNRSSHNRSSRSWWPSDR